MASWRLDRDAGAIVLAAATVGRDATLAHLVNALRGEGIEAAPRNAWSLCHRADVEGKPLELTFHFFENEALRYVTMVDSALASVHELVRTMHDRAWLSSVLGPPHYENGRGALYAFPWGFIHAARGVVRLTYHPPRGLRVPLPDASNPNDPCHRCLTCGFAANLGYGYEIIRAGHDRGGAPCEECGDVDWVQCGSMSEFYGFSQRPDVCEVGQHRAADVKTFTLVSRNPPARPGMRRVEKLFIKACPVHVDALRLGIDGCFLED
jgi:hypothetical protein